MRITVTGGLEFRRVEIRPDAVDPDDVEMLQDLVLAALHDAMAQVGDLQQCVASAASIWAGSTSAASAGWAVGLGGARWRPLSNDDDDGRRDPTMSEVVEPDEGDDVAVEGSTVRL